MKRHILLPTDFSENAWSAVLYALKLYRNEPCVFYLLNSWSFSNSTNRTYITSHYIDEKKEETKNQLNEWKDLAAAESTNAEHKFKTVFGNKSLLDSIESVVKEYDIDLIIMATKGAKGAKEFLFGTNTVNMINKMKSCPILVVPNAYEFKELKQIAFPTDFNHFYGEELLPIKQLSKLFNSKIRVVHVNEKENLTDKQNYNLAMLKAYLEDYKHRFHWMTGYSKKEPAINDFIKENDINVLTMINYEHSIIENIIKEPILKHIGFHPIVPFLVIPSMD